jgi:4'-phosphopantetheinyl transferase
MRFAWDLADPGDRRATSRRLARMLDPGLIDLRSGPCGRCGGPHGRPSAPGADAALSVTYAGGYALVAVLSAGAGAAIGVDAEAGRPGDPAALSRLRPGATLRTWTRIEAALKADGRGLAVDPSRVRIEEDGDHWRAFVPGRSNAVLGIDVAGPPGIVVSAALLPAAAEAVPGGRATA